MATIVPRFPNAPHLDKMAAGVVEVEGRVRLGKSGRLVLPASYRKALDLKAGDELIIELVGDGVRLSSLRSAIRHAQALVARHVPRDRSLSQELIAERRAEHS